MCHQAILSLNRINIIPNLRHIVRLMEEIRLCQVRTIHILSQSHIPHRNLITAEVIIILHQNLPTAATPHPKVRVLQTTVHQNQVVAAVVEVLIQNQVQEVVAVVVASTDNINC